MKKKRNFCPACPDAEDVIATEFNRDNWLRVCPECAQGLKGYLTLERAMIRELRAGTWDIPQMALPSGISREQLRAMLLGEEEI